MSIEFDEIAKQFFDSAEEFAYAIKKYQEYLAARDIYPTWAEFEEMFLMKAENEFGRVDAALDSFERWSKAVGLYTNIVSPKTRIGEEPKAHAHSGTSISNDGLIDISLKDVFPKFINEKKQNWKPTSDMETVYKNEIFPLLIEITGDISAKRLSEKEVIEFKDAVLKLPKNRRKNPKYRNLKLSDLLKLEIPKEDQLSQVTKKNYLDRCCTFFKFLENNKYSKANLEKPLAGVIKKTNRQNEERDKYTDDDLRKLFNSKDYLQGLHRESFMFWVPLIGLLSGARLNEICQLHVDDIKCIDNIHVFDFNENDQATTLKSLKRSYHNRQTPIHPQLIKMGFLDFVEQQKQLKNVRLFSSLPYRNDNKYADKAQKWFNTTYTNARNCNITTPKTSFHSLRHNYISFLTTKLNKTAAAFAKYVGQSAGGSVAEARYSKPEEIKEIHALFSKIDYSSVIDFSRIRNWEYQRFNA